MRSFAFACGLQLKVPPRLNTNPSFQYFASLSFRITMDGLAAAGGAGSTGYASEVSGSVVDSIIEELRAQEGELFQKPQAQELFSAVRRMVLRGLGGAYHEYAVKSDRPEAYAAILDAFYAWHASAATEEVKAAAEMRTNPPIAMLLQQVAFLYAKMLYRKCDFAKWSMKRPSIETLLRGVYTRLTDPLSPSGLRSGTFFRLDAIKQDYILRQAFREALSDCIEVYERDTGRAVAPDGKGGAVVEGKLDRGGKTDKTDKTDKAAVPAVIPAAVARAMVIAAASKEYTDPDLDKDDDGVPEGDVFPSDSISSVLGRSSGKDKDKDKGKDKDGGGSDGDDDDEVERPRLDLTLPKKTDAEPRVEPRAEPRAELKAEPRAEPKKTEIKADKGKGKAAATPIDDDLRSVRSTSKPAVAGGGSGGGGSGSVASAASGSSARSAMSRASQQRKGRVLDIVEEAEPKVDADAAKLKPKRKVVLTHEPDSPARRSTERRRKNDTDSDSPDDKDDESSAVTDTSGTTGTTRTTRTTTTTTTAAS